MLVLFNALPPLEAEYHLTEVPVAVRSATVWLAAEQNDWEVDPVGAPGVVLTVTVTSNRVVLSQPVTVCDA